MKIYTEITYEWIDGGLKEISSNSFNYEGEVDLCKGVSINFGTGSGGTLGDITGGISDIGSGATGAVTEGLSTGTEVIGEGLADLGQPNTGQFGTGQGGTMGDISSGLAHVGGEINTGINTGLSFIGYLGNKLSEFLYGSSKPSDVVVKNEKTAGGKDKQTAAELGTNKGEQRSRSSLKIG